MDFTPTHHHDTYPAIQTSNHRGRVVLITGASRGIGRTTADVSFARASALGIAIAARTSLDDVEAEILAAARQAGHPTPRVLRLLLDVTNETSVTDALSHTEKHFGRLDVLVNNAGYTYRNGSTVAESLTPSRW